MAALLPAFQLTHSAWPLPASPVQPHAAGAAIWTSAARPSQRRKPRPPPPPPVRPPPPPPPPLRQPSLRHRPEPAQPPGRPLVCPALRAPAPPQVEVTIQTAAAAACGTLPPPSSPPSLAPLEPPLALLLPPAPRQHPPLAPRQQLSASRETHPTSALRRQRCWPRPPARCGSVWWCMLWTPG